DPLPELGQGVAASRSRRDTPGKGPAGAPDRPRALRDADPHGPPGGAARSEDGPLEPRGSPPPRPRPPPPAEADDPRRHQGGSRLPGRSGPAQPLRGVSHDPDVGGIWARVAAPG